MRRHRRPQNALGRRAQLTPAPILGAGFDALSGEVEIGWTFLSRAHGGGKTNRELKSLMLGHAFQFVQRVVFLVGPDSRRSQRALEKLGARHPPSGGERVKVD